MKYALQADLSFNTVLKRDAVYTKIETFLSGKPVWGHTSLTKVPDSSISIEVRFEQRPDLDNIFDLVKTELNKLTGVTATFSKHACSHDEGNQPCKVEEIATIVR